MRGGVDGVITPGCKRRGRVVNAPPGSCETVVAGAQRSFAPPMIRTSA
ncbi:hypothetical protein [Nocardia sp. BMG111209]|nr:hypothetical protein [Nocardia sp. BMG111209]